MAAAAPSPLASSVEKTNGAKLSRLLIDGGTTVLRNVFDSYHPPATLAADLSANHLTLNNLYKKKVLHKPQWDLLFPPGGATPDSKTFDITLLFLLLTNICGLSPPLSGWHKPPPSSDTSLEANLARVKLYRNELYGHVTSTGVQTAVFNAKWQEISAVLVALGLNPAEVVSLKSAPCGEDYIGTVMEWAKNDEEIKSQLREVLETQQQARQMQEEDQKTLQDTHKAVEGVRQIHQDTHQVVEEVLKTQQVVCQTQQEDSRTLQDTQKAVEDVRQIQQDTHQVVEEVLKTQQEVYQTQQGLRQTQHEVHQTQQEAHGAIQEVVKTQKENRETLQQVKKSVENMTERRNMDKEDEILSKLAKINSRKVVEYHAERYQEGTRASVFERVEKWLDDSSSSNRVMVISGNAGMGKSVISAIVCKIMQEAGRLSGTHFCQHDKERYRNPKIMLQSLACQLSDSLPEYKNALLKTLSRNLGVELNNMEVKDLFEVLFEEPLSELKGPGRNILMVVDGLDESQYQGRNELLDVIACHFTKLPRWIRFLVTTRPEINIADSLKSFNPLQLEPNNEENQRDIRLLFEERLSDVIQQGHREVIINELVKKSEGLILYAYLLVLFIKENVSNLTLEQLDSTLPSGISSIYRTYFQRLETELCKELKIKEEQFLTFLSALTTAREPLPLDFVAKMMLSGSSSLGNRRKVNKVIACISALLPVQGDCIHFFHKSLKDWLTDISLYEQHDFTVDEQDGHRILSKLCTEQLEDIKQKGVGCVQLSDTANYALKHGFKHLLQLNRAESCDLVIKKYVVDLELVYAKLCVSSATPADDFLWIEQQKIAKQLSEDSKRMLNDLTFFLRRYMHDNAFSNRPQVFLQTVVNEGGSLLSSVASNLITDKYPEIPYMEFVHKETQQGTVFARFQCSSEVACFDVSPQRDFMVCECIDGTIQLWSLHTGKLLWGRPVIVKKRTISWRDAFRMSQPLTCSSVYSFYRSVVFHPTADVVLPGVLSHAYTLEGDQKPLFPESKCRFTVCSISGDLTTMLTDCPDDAKCIIMWSLKNGSEITRTTRNEDVLSFAWSRDGKLLAISHSTGSISIVDAMDGFRTLAEMVIPWQDVCGMIKFSPDCRFIFCLCFRRWLGYNIYRLDLKMAEPTSCTLHDCKTSVPWDFESQSETGFLLGDPISSYVTVFEFVLNEQTVLRSSPRVRCIDMMNINKLRKTDEEAKGTLITIRDIVFSLSGETVYVVSDTAEPKASAWDVSSMKLLGQRSIQTVYRNHLVAVKEGVLLTTASGTLELWSYELSKCVRSWTNINGIKGIIPIPVSEGRVACEAENKVIILDTTSGEIVSTFPISYYGRLMACNSKCQLLTYSSETLQLADGETMLWEIVWDYEETELKVFSLSEQFAVISFLTRRSKHRKVYVLDAISGDKLHILCKCKWLFDCRFVSDEECVISSDAVSGGYCLQLFNARSGDLLNVIDLDSRANCLAVCPCKRLLAIGIGLSDSKHGFKLIQVHLPQDKDGRKSKRTLNTGDHKKVQVENEEVCSCLVDDDDDDDYDYYDYDHWLL
ncbi:hypothetical protein ACROYT_G030761 [Oculina patagonica]